MHLNKLPGRRMGRGGIAQAKEVLKFSYMLNSTVGASETATGKLFGPGHINRRSAGSWHEHT